MKMKKYLIRWIFRATAILTLGVLAACGSSSNESITGNVAGTSGIAVDPYIVGAVFEEVTADGQTIIQRQSTPSDTLGRFSFAHPVQAGSVVRIKQGNKGNHAGMPYSGTIKRLTTGAESAPLVVSPLTTLLTNGMSADEIIFLMADAGLPGLLREDLTSDPMAGLSDVVGDVSDEMLIALQANMAVNSFLEAIDNFDYPATTQAQNVAAVNLADVTQAVQQTLNAQIYNDLAIFLQSEISSPITLGDVIQTAARMQRTIVARIKEELASSNGNPAPGYMGQILNDTLAEAPQLAKQIAQGRLGMPGTPPDPGTDPNPDPAPGIDGSALFAQSCATCHTVGGGGFDLAGDGALIAGKFAPGHMGVTLNNEEKTAIADYLDGNTGSNPDPGTDPGNDPLPDPGTPPSGAELYASECQGCHGNLQNSDVVDRSAAGITQAIDANIGNMGFIVLTAAEIQAIADAMPAVLPPAPPAPEPTEPGSPIDAAALFSAQCAGCHSITGGSNDLRGDGALVAGRFIGAHFNRTLNADEITAMAAYLNAQGGTTPDPGTNPEPIPDPTPPAPVDFANCLACHASKPNGPSNPAAVGAHAAHLSLPGMTGNCNLCHIEENHDWQVDLVTEFDITNTRPASFNANGTCSNISCHGGVTTPAWDSGRITVSTECQKCHVAGTSVYTGYASGEHNKHRNFDCASCHDTAKLAVNHFGDLTTRQFEQNPAETLLPFMNYVNNNCTVNCHGENHRNERWR